MNDTATVKLVDVGRVEELLNLLEGYPEDPQTVFDLTFTALVVAELQGVDAADLHAAFAQQYPLARKFVDKVSPEE